MTKNYIVDYLSMANRDIMVYEEGSFTQRHVYDHNSRRISTELTYAEGTQRGEMGENIASDTAVRLSKVWYRTSHLDSTLFALDEQGEVVTHTIYDPWGNPQSETKTDLNYTGLDNRNNYTGYTWDVTLELYFAQARFYDPENHRFTQEDPFAGYLDEPMSLVKYLYVQNSPLKHTDPLGLMPKDTLNEISDWYRYGLISDDNLALVVILANLAHASRTLWDNVKSFLSTSPVVMIQDWLYTDDETASLLEDTTPTNQSIYVAFHEIAQIVAAQQIKKASTGLNAIWGYPELEERYLTKKEIDIKWGDYIWEVKPSYSSTSSWTTSLSKYINNYADNKNETDYEWWETIIGNKPGGEFDTKRIKLFKFDGVQYTIGTESKGPGKVGYFFEYVCDDGNTTTYKAKDMAGKLQSLFKIFGAVKNVRNLGTLVGAALLATLVPGQLDDVVIDGAAANSLDNVIIIFSELGVDGAVEAAGTFWALISSLAA